MIRVNAPPLALSQWSDGLTNRFVLSALRSLDSVLPEAEQRQPEDLATMGLDAYLKQLTERAERPATEHVLIFDQFEEIFTIDPTDWRSMQDFFIQVGAALGDSNLWALFSLHEDYVANLDRFLQFYPNPAPVHLPPRTTATQTPAGSRLWSLLDMKMWTSTTTRSIDSSTIYAGCGSSSRTVPSRPPSVRSSTRSGTLRLSVTDSGSAGRRYPGGSQIDTQHVAEFANVEHALENDMMPKRWQRWRRKARLPSARSGDGLASI